MPNLGYKAIKTEWIDHPDIRDIVRENLIGEVLNFPCGLSPLGDVKADVDADTNPDVLASLDRIPFAENSFDTVYCDPPFSFYDFGISQSWIQRIYEIASKRLVLQGTPRPARVSPVGNRDVYILRPKPGSSKRWNVTLEVIDKPNGFDTYE